jgi:hypothetical protein
MNERGIMWYQSSRGTEDDETGEGSLSILIVLFERWEISSMNATE